MSARAAPMSTSAGSSCAAQESTGGSSSGNNSLEQKTALYIAYPINSVVELTLSPNAEVVRGVVYTTDEISNSVVLKKSLPHSNLTSEIRIVNAAAVTEKKILNSGPGGNTEGAGSSRQNGENGDISDCIPEELTAPLPAVSKKSLEERERRAIRLAEESFHHINQKVSISTSPRPFFLLTFIFASRRRPSAKRYSTASSKRATKSYGEGSL